MFLLALVCLLVWRLGALLKTLLTDFDEIFGIAQ